MIKLSKYLSLIFCFLLIFCSKVFSSEIVNDILIKGNERISSETIKMFSDVQLNQEINDDNLNEILKNLYQTDYFKDVKVNFKSGLLTIIVLENPIIGKVNLEGLKSKRVQKKIKDALSLKQRSSYNEIILNNDLEKIYDTLRNLGYYFPKVETLIEEKVSSIIDITFKIDLGNKTKIKKINFTGNDFFKESKLKSIIISEEYKPWKFISGRKYLSKENVDFDKKLLKNFYLNKGFYNVQINSSFAKLNKDQDFELIFNIVENEKYYFDNLTLNLPSDYNVDNYNEIIKLFSKLKNKPYSITRISKIINEIDKISTNEQFEAIKSTVIENIVDNKINLEFNVEESDKILVSKINIFGNNVTKESVIRNQLELDEGDQFNNILATKSINNIKSLNYFRNVELEILDKDEGSKELNIAVEEKPTGEITAGAGVGTSGGTIGFGIKENNYLGSGVKLDANMTITEDSIKGLFSVNNPNYKNTNKSFYTTIQATETNKLTDFGYKTGKTGFSFGTAFEYYKDLNLGLGLNTFYETIEADSTASTRQKDQVGNYFDTFVNLNFDYDKRDQRFQPTDGFRSNYSVNVPLISDSNTFSNTYSFSNYYQYLEKNVFKSSLFLKATSSISGENIKLSERIYIPSSKLRGFEYGKIGPKDGDDFIGGNYAVVLNFSSSIPQLFENSQSTDFSVFMDVANLWGVDYNSGLDTDKIRSSVGVSMDYFSIVGPLNFSLSYPMSKDNTDVTETFRFNLGTTF